MAENLHSVPPESPNPKPAGDADEHLRHLLNPEVSVPWYRSLFENVRDTIRPPKLPPLEVTSKPVAVKDIWGAYGRSKRSSAMSVAIHVGIVALMFTAARSETVQDAVIRNITPVFAPDIDPYMPKMAPKKETMGGGGGGGDNSPLPPSKGRLPRPSLKQFTPPMAVVNNPNPKLVMEPTIIVPPEVPLPNVNMNVWGDPLAKIGPPSNGPGSGGGIGTGSGGGVGSGKGGGFGPGEGGGVGGGVFKVGGGVTAPSRSEERRVGKEC